MDKALTGVDDLRKKRLNAAFFVDGDIGKLHLKMR
ncbi:hypothetical protein HDG32_000683 [Paraburkholderia sp. CI2]|nr:hypothetical protein [Paraburkholderia sp. CI2]